MRLASISILDRFPEEESWTIRIVIPGVDDGSAVYFEANVKRETQEEVEKLLDNIMPFIPKIERQK